MSFRQFDYVVQSEITRREDGWDHVRHIMTSFGGGDPKQIIRLKRDRVEIEPDELERIKKVVERLKQTW